MSRALVVAALIGVPIGIVSRLVDTALWAPPWIGNILSPWLAAAWLTAAAVGGSRWLSAAVGVAAILGIIAGYVALAGPDLGRLVLPLATLTLLGGAAWGVAGGEWHVRRALSGAVLVAAVMADVVTILRA